MTSAWPDPFDLRRDEELRREFRKLPDNFSISSDHPVAQNPGWVLGPVILTRDAGLLAQSNHAVLLKELKSMRRFKGQWEVMTASHWGFGWVEHLCFQAFRKDGKTSTALYAWLRDWFLTLAERYHCADDEHYSRLQYETALENIETKMFVLLDTEADPDLARRVYDWLWNHEEKELADHDGRGPNPSREAVRRALEKVLGRSLSDE